MPKILQEIAIGNADRTGFQTAVDDEDILNSLSKAPTIQEKLGEPETLKLNIKSGTALSRSDSTLLQRRNVVRLTYDNGEIREFRVDGVNRETSGSKDTTVNCSPLWMDLGDRRVRNELSSGYQMINIPFYNIRVDELMANLLSNEYNAPDYFDVGNIDSLFAPQRVSILSNNSTHLEVISELCQELEAEWELNYDETTDTYLLNVMQKGAIGGGIEQADSRPIEMGNAEGNRIRLNKKNEKGGFFTRLVPTGGQENNTFGIQDANFPVDYFQLHREGSPNQGGQPSEGSPRNENNYTHIIGQTIIHLKDRVIPEDDFPSFPYFGNEELGIYPIDFMDAPNVVVVDDNGGLQGIKSGKFYLDQEGTTPAFVEDEQATAEIGLVEQAYRRTDITPFENLLEDFGVSADMTDWFGDYYPYGMTNLGNSTIVQEPVADHVKYGSLGARITGNEGEGIQTDLIDLQPTSDNPYFSFWVAAKVIRGGYRIELVDSNGNVYPANETAESTKTTTHAIEVSGIKPASGDARIRIVHTRDNTEIVLDAITLVQSPNAYEYTESMGPRALFVQAVRHLHRNGGLNNEVRTAEFYDSAYDDDSHLEVEIGSWVRVMDDYNPDTDSYNIDFTARVIELQYDESANGRIWKKAKLSRSEDNLSSFFQNNFVSKESMQDKPSIQVVNRGTGAGSNIDPSKLDAQALMNQIREVDGYDSGLVAEDSFQWNGNQFSDYIDQPVRKADAPTFRKQFLTDGMAVNGTELFNAEATALNMAWIAEGSITDAMLSSDFMPSNITTDDLTEGEQNLFYDNFLVERYLFPNDQSQPQVLGTAAMPTFAGLTITSDAVDIGGKRVSAMAFKDTVALSDLDYSPVTEITGTDKRVVVERTGNSYSIDLPTHIGVYGLNITGYMTIYGNDVYHTGNLPDLVAQGEFDEFVNTTLPNEYVTVTGHNDFVNNSLGEMAFADVVRKENLNFQTTDTSNIISRINASTETVADTTTPTRINQAKISIGSNVDYAAGYDPSTKAEQADLNELINTTLPNDYVTVANFNDFVNNSLGGLAFADVVYKENLNFTPTDESNIITRINAATEDNDINGDKLVITPDTVFSTAALDPATKLEQGDFNTFVNGTLPNTYVQQANLFNEAGFIQHSLIEAGSIAEDRLAFNTATADDLNAYTPSTEFGGMAFKDTVAIGDLSFNPVTEITGTAKRVVVERTGNSYSLDLPTHIGVYGLNITGYMTIYGNDVYHTGNLPNFLLQADFDNFVNNTLPNDYVTTAGHDDFVNNSLGNLAFADTVYKEDLNFTTTDVSNIISRINQSTETKTDGTTPQRINQNKIAIGSNVEFTAGYDPSTKVEQSEYNTLVNDTLPNTYVTISGHNDFVNNSLGSMAFEDTVNYLPATATADDISEGQTNKYYTDDKVMTLLAPQSTNSFQEVGTASDVNFRSLRLSSFNLHIGDRNLANVGDMAFKDTVAQSDLDFTPITNISGRSNQITATDNGDGTYTLSFPTHISGYGFNAEMYMTINQNDVYHEGNLPDFVEPSNLMAELNSNAGTENIDPALLIVDENTLFPNADYDPSTKVDTTTFEQWRNVTLPQNYLNLSDPATITSKVVISSGTYGDLFQIERGADEGGEMLLGSDNWIFAGLNNTNVIRFTNINNIDVNGDIVATQSGRNRLNLQNGSHGSGYGVVIESGAADFDGGRVYTTSGYNHEFRINNTGGGSYDLLVWGRISGMSDMKVKDNIREIPDYKERLLGISGRMYERNDVAGNPTEIGLVAQQIKEFFPMAVHEIKGGDSDGMLTVDDRPITAALVEGFKMHENRLDEIEKSVRELIDLEDRVEELESEVRQLKQQ